MVPAAPSERPAWARSGLRCGVSLQAPDQASTVRGSARSLPRACVWKARRHSGGVSFPNRTFLVIIELDTSMAMCLLVLTTVLGAWAGHPRVMVGTLGRQ